MSNGNEADPSNLLRQQTALAKFGELALKSNDLDQILAEACSLVGQALGTDLAKVMELQDDGSTLLVRAGVGWKPGIVGVLTLTAAPNTSEGIALSTGEPMISPDIATEARFAYAPFLIENGVKAVANVVIIGAQGRQAFGILQIDSREPRQFGIEDTTFLRSYANLLAAAVDRLRSIGAMREGQERLRLALEVGELGSWAIDLAKGTTTRTQRYDQIFGYAEPSHAWSYDIFLKHVLPEDRGNVDTAFCSALAAGTEWRSECRICRAGDGALRWIEARGRLVGARGNLPASHLLGIVADITERKQAEAALHQSNDMLKAKVEAQRAQEEIEARFRYATQAGRLGVWELDLRTGELTASAVCQDNFGHDQKTPFTLARMQSGTHPDDRERLRAAIDHSKATGADCNIECRIIRVDGSTRWVQLQAQVIQAPDGTASCLAGISLDITERILTQERIRQSQRVEAVGRLTAGVAHDFNNVLQALLGGLELAADEVVDQPNVTADLELALRAGQRGARLTSHLLSFSRQQTLHPAPLNLELLLRELSRTLIRTLGHKIAVHIEIAPDIPHVLADAAHLDSALLNLALNASDAMPQGGELRIKAHATSTQVVITISDTGLGMTPEVLAQACEPFFTTKGVKGSGLGLSMVQGFALQSGGELHIKSKPGQGTDVEIGLPLVLPVPSLASAPERVRLIGNGRVLVVDDDLDVGRVTAAFLRNAGFDVTTVGSSNEALAELGAGSAFNALVADFAMAGMNGADLVVQARERHPALAALIITGYAGAEGLESLPSDVAILRKPFQRPDLVRMVKALVEDTPSEALLKNSAPN